MGTGVQGVLGEDSSGEGGRPEKTKVPVDVFTSLGQARSNLGQIASQTTCLSGRDI